MLVLSRKIGEEIVIGGNISVSIEAIQGNKVRLGITAPDSVTVDRREVHERRILFTNDRPDVKTASGAS